MELDDLVITLGKWELVCGGVVGVHRQSESLVNRNRDGAISKESGYGVHCEGALGELALAKYLGLYWPASVNAFKDPDIPPHIQVKTAAKADGALFVPTGAKDHEVYVLLTGRAPVFTIRGWLLAKCAKTFPIDTFMSPAHKVPQSALNPISTLPYEPDYK